jgi:hypothetical protein
MRVRVLLSSMVPLTAPRAADVPAGQPLAIDRDWRPTANNALYRERADIRKAGHEGGDFLFGPAH